MKRNRNLLKSRAIHSSIVFIFLLGFVISDSPLWGYLASGNTGGNNSLSHQCNKPDCRINILQWLERLKDAAGMYLLPALYKELGKDDL
jgi:hypothetical protein